MKSLALRLGTVVVLCSVGGLGEAWAQLPTCSFDRATGVLTVLVNGSPAAQLERDRGSIRMPGRGCSAVDETELIVVRGGDLDDSVHFIGNFFPGRTPEPGDPSQSEIEYDIDLGGGNNTVKIVTGSNEENVMTAARFTENGIDLHADGDQDVTLAGPYRVILRAQHRLRTVFDGSLYPGRLMMYAPGLDSVLVGGAGDDLLAAGGGPNSFVEGGEGNDRMGGGRISLGQGGDDRIGGTGLADHIDGGPGDDIIEGGPGDDILLGGDGDDDIIASIVLDGADQILGGPGTDTVSYAKRGGPFSDGASVSVTLDGLANDGDVGGEGDHVALDIENIVGGALDDILVGSAAANRIQGGPGDDEIHGEGGDDRLEGQDGADFLDGGAGTNMLRGDAGNDILVGSLSGKDTFVGGEGDDEISLNTDGRVERVNCGPGLDSAEPNDEDIFIDCETPPEESASPE
jgi:Ca2+-binding RTX toxin-like protein